MRHFIIIISFVLIFFSGSVLADVFIEKNFTQMAEKIENISSEKDLKAVTEKWEELSEISEIIIDHGDLEEVSQHLWAMEEEIKYDYDEFMESKALAVEMLYHIKDRNTLKLINIL